MLDTDKFWIKDLVSICARKGLRHVVFSPGSRCAPLVIAFNQHPGIKCISIIDERSAAFFALGMAQQLQEPVGLVCTSGSATLNYAPAVAEAFYSKVPLVLFTADRPNEWIGQADGQAIRQFEIYRNYIKRSYELPNDIKNDDKLWYSNRMVSEAINMSMIPDMGPVHINVPLAEPLYNLAKYETYDEPRIIDSTPIKPYIGPEVEERLVASWNKYQRILIVAGSLTPDHRLQNLLNRLSDKGYVPVLAEITSNLNGPNLIKVLDPALEVIPKDQKEIFQPDLLITFGGAIVSKKLKRFLRQYQPAEHWFVDESGDHTDTYQTLSNVIRLHPADFVEMLLDRATMPNPDYWRLWQQAYDRSLDRHEEILDSAPFCDLVVFDRILKNLPEGTNLQLANSTPVRYVGLFDTNKLLNATINCNRGTSGIDGTISTAAGAAYANGKPTTVVTGDLSFVYDSNALWNKHLSGNLRIIVINNGGGNIFRIIQGPSDLGKEILETYFETPHTVDISHLAQAFGIPYYFCDSLETLEDVLPRFYQPHNGKCVILEVKTPNETSANILKKYLNI